jgi:hypothetical protein
MKTHRSLRWLVPAALVIAGCASDPQSPTADQAFPEGIARESAETSGWIGPLGGALTLQGVTLTIPAGALTKQTPITMHRMSDGSVELGPDGQTFLVPVQLLFAVPFGGNGADYAAQWFDPASGAWVDIQSTNVVLGRLALLQHFSLYRMVTIN